MPEILSVTFVIHEKWIADFEKAILINAQASLNNEPGCDRFDVCRDENNPRVFYLYEIYHDKEAIDAVDEAFVGAIIKLRDIAQNVICVQVM